MSATSVPTGRPPVQMRARARVDDILDAAQRLMVERGAAGFTMSELADTSGVSIGSLYRWFPAQSSVVRALAERHLESGRAAALEAVAGGGRATDRLERALRAYLSGADDPLTVQIMRAIRADEALRSLDRADTQANARLLADAVGLPPDRAPAVALVIDLAGHLLIDLADHPRAERPAMVRTFIAMSRAAIRPT